MHVHIQFCKPRELNILINTEIGSLKSSILLETANTKSVT